MVFNRKNMVLGFVSIVLSPLLWAQVGIFRADAFSVSPIQKTLFEQETFNIHSNQKVWENPYWLALLHYKAASQLSTDLSKDWVSDIETPTFFLSPNGKLDPKAELLANLKSAKQDAEYGCRFPARLRLLQHLYPKASLSTPKEATCVALGQWVQAFDQAQLSLVFPSQDLEQPASVFGHLFLMVSQKAYSLNAKTAAVTASANDTSTVQYLYKGLTGGYTGTFKLHPFYQPLKEYLMVKGRDVWIYPIRLQPSQVRFWLEHLWELRHVSSRYYFTSKNCAYQVIESLRILEPQSFSPAADLAMLPAEGLKQIDRVFGLEAPNVEVSLNRRIHWYARDMAFSRRMALRGKVESGAFSDADIQALSDSEWHYASLLLQKRKHSTSLSQEKRQTASKLFARFRVFGRTRRPIPDLYMTALDPLKSHEPHRMGLSYSGQRLEWHSRFLYHSVEDPETGFDPGVDIEVGNMTAVIAPKPQLSEFGAWNMAHLTPHDDSIAWQLEATWRSSRFRPLGGWQTFIGAGKSLAWNHNWTTYGLFGLGRMDSHSWATPILRVGGFHSIPFSFRTKHLSFRPLWEASTAGESATRAEIGAFVQEDNRFSIGVKALHEEAVKEEPLQQLSAEWLLYF